MQGGKWLQSAVTWHLSIWVRFHSFRTGLQVRPLRALTAVRLQEADNYLRDSENCGNERVNLCPSPNIIRVTKRSVLSAE
jgi:hypothetical protein